MSKNSIHIPETIEEATDTLGGLGRLLTAKQWERAAIVYAFTRDGEAGRPPGNRSEITTILTPREFAGLNLSGLSSDQTVRNYRAAWKQAIDESYAKPVSPGDVVELPDSDEHPFPPTGGNTLDSPRDRDQEAVTRFVRNPAVVGERKAEIVTEALSDDYVAEQVADIIGRNADLSARLEKARRSRQGSEAKPRQSTPAIDDWREWTAAQQQEFDRKTVSSVRHILKALFLREQGYIAAGEAEMLLALIDKTDLDTELEALLKEGGAA